jgi:hypothetical protein
LAGGCALIPLLSTNISWHQLEKPPNQSAQGPKNRLHHFDVD